jgi:hypothetical protein
MTTSSKSVPVTQPMPPQVCKEKNGIKTCLLASGQICNKAVNDLYAQNLYAALCNNFFRCTKSTCISFLPSMRKSAELVCLMRNQRPEEHYLDWYSDHIDLPTKPTVSHNRMRREYVSEGVITAEIQRDLLELGWEEFTCTDHMAFLLHRASWSWPQGAEVTAPVSPRIARFLRSKKLPEEHVTD